MAAPFSLSYRELYWQTMQAFTIGWVWQLRRGLGFVFLMINQTNSSHAWMYYGLTTKPALNLLYPFSMKQKCLIWTRIIAWDREQNATQVDIMLIWWKRSEYYRAGRSIPSGALSWNAAHCAAVLWQGRQNTLHHTVAQVSWLEPMKTI